MNLYGEWGSGKSTFLALLEEGLKNRNDWVVVTFNSWRHQHLGPQWWPLMDGIFRRGTADLPFFKRIRVKFRERFRRLMGGYGVPIVAMVLAGLLGLISLQFPLPLGLRNLIRPITEFIAIITPLASAIVVVMRSLFTGSASAAAMFQKFASDPMETIRKHYRDFIGQLNRPVMVFIDDLDRCRKEYVVRLLESLQTLFNDSRVFYTVAADRRWITACFESTYRDLGKSVVELGRPTGFLFLEKLFQLAVGVPPVNPQLSKNFLERLLKETPATEKENARTRQKHFNDALSQAFQEFEPINNEVELYEKLTTETGDALTDQARVAAAILKSSGTTMERSRKHRLQRFGALVEPNPRAIKLLITAYGVYVAHAMAGGVRELNDDFLDQIALWTILSLRFPQVAEYLERNPDDLQLFVDPAPSAMAHVPEEIRHLAGLPRISRVLRGLGIEHADTGELVDMPMNPGILKVIVGKESWEEYRKDRKNQHRKAKV